MTFLLYDFSPNSVCMYGSSRLSYESGKVRARVDLHRHFGCKFMVLGGTRSRFVEVKKGVANTNVVILQYLVTSRFPQSPGCIGFQDSRVAGF